MFNAHPHCKYFRQKPGCSTLSKAWSIHESPAIKSARKRLYRRSQVGLLMSSFRWEPKAGVFRNTHQGSPSQASPPPVDLYRVTLVTIQKVRPSPTYSTQRDCILLKCIPISLEQKEMTGIKEVLVNSYQLQGRASQETN